MKKLLLSLVTASVVGWLIADQLSAELAEVLSVPRSPLAAHEAVPARAPLPDRDTLTAAITSRDIFGLGLKKTDVTVTALPLEAVLLATIVADDPVGSSALIRFQEHTDGFGIGDQLTGTTTVIDIKPRTVTLEHEGALHTLTFTERDTAPPRPATEPTGRVSREEVEAFIAKGGGGLRVVPHKSSDGDIDGYRVSGIRRKSLLHRLGAKNGDIVHSVNGIALSSTGATLDAYSALQDAEEFTVEITRRSQRMTLEVVLE